MELETEPPMAEALGTEIVPDVTHESGVTHESVAIAQSGIEKRPTIDLSLDGEDESAASHWASATLQLTQDERFVRAGQADPEALQDLFRQELAAYGVTQVDVELRGVGLQVSLSGREVPDQEILEPLVKECTVQLGLTKIQTIELYGQKEGSDLPFWRSIFKPAELERTAPRQKPPEVKPVTFIFSGTSSQSTANVHEAVLKDADVLPESIATQNLSSLPEHGALNSGSSDSGDSDSGDSDSGALGYVDHERQEESDSGFSTVSLDPVSLDVNSAPIASLETPPLDPAPSGLGSNELSRDAQAGASSDVLISLDSPVPDSESVSQVSPDVSPDVSPEPKPVVENLETTAKRKAVEAFLARYAAGERSFIKIDLSDSDLSGVSLTLADLQEAHLVWSNLEGASLYHVNLLGAKLRQANLKGATLRNANLRGTDFLNANLSGADLSWSNLTGANLTGANLTDANLKNAVLDNVIMPDGTRLD